MKQLDWAVEALRTGAMPGSPAVPKAARTPGALHAASAPRSGELPEPVLQDVGRIQGGVRAGDTAPLPEEEAMDLQEVIEDSQSLGEPYHEAPSSPGITSAEPGAVLPGATQGPTDTIALPMLWPIPAINGTILPVILQASASKPMCS